MKFGVVPTEAEDAFFAEQWEEATLDVIEAARRLVTQERQNLKHARASQALINLEKALRRLDEEES